MKWKLAFFLAVLGWAAIVIQFWLMMQNSITSKLETTVRFFSFFIVPRPYRALGYPVIPALYVLGSFALVFNTLMERPTASIAGLGLVALGLPFYFLGGKTTSRG